jgi:quinol monooxygenase YgiN
MIYVIATLDVKPGMEGEVMRATMPLIAATRDEEGCISYEVAADIANPGRLVFVERWESQDDLEAHFAGAYRAAFSDAVRQFVEQERVEIIEPKHVEVI